MDWDACCAASSAETIGRGVNFEGVESKEKIMRLAPQRLARERQSQQLALAFRLA